MWFNLTQTPPFKAPFCKIQSDVHFENARECKKPPSVCGPRPPACSASVRRGNKGFVPFPEVVILPQGLSWVLCSEPRGLQRGGGSPQSRSHSCPLWVAGELQKPLPRPDPDVGILGVVV